MYAPVPTREAEEFDKHFQRVVRIQAYSLLALVIVALASVGIGLFQFQSSVTSDRVIQSIDRLLLHLDSSWLWDATAKENITQLLYDLQFALNRTR
jgi:hypothetical protein